MFAATEPALPAPAVAPLWGRWSLRWMAPLAAGAVAAIIWITVPGDQSHDLASKTVARVEKQTPPVSATPVPQPAPAPALPPAAPEQGAVRDQRTADLLERSAQLAAQQAMAAQAERGPVPAPGEANAVPSPMGERTSVEPSLRTSMPAPMIQAQSGERSFTLGASQVESLPQRAANQPFDGAASKIGRAGGAANAPETARAEIGGETRARQAVVGPAGPGRAAAPLAPYDPTAPVAGQVTGTVPASLPPAPIAAAAPPPPAPAVASAAPIVAPATILGGRGQGNVMMDGISAMDARAGVPVFAPGASVQWRVMVGGRVERSINSGATWMPVVFKPPVFVNAAAAPSASVCWLVGQGGFVLLTTDTNRFTSVSFPEPVDLVGVRAVDGRQATVVAADGREFVTNDAGGTWRLVAR